MPEFLQTATAGANAGQNIFYILLRDLIAAVVILTFVLLVVMYPMIWGLRRVMAAFQVRIGPNRTGYQGLLQTPADALKLLTKEDIIPTAADKWPFIIAPIVVFVPAFMVYVVMPFGPDFIARDLSAGIVYITAITGIPVMGIMMAGWASNNKWALFGTFRAAAQLISYEVPLILALLVPVMLTGTLSLQQMVLTQGTPVLGGYVSGWMIFLPPVWIAFIVFIIAGIAESNMVPFDIMEAESELVAGFNTEYSGMKFALFFLAEFAASFTIAAIGVTLFLGGWQPLFTGWEHFGLDKLFALAGTDYPWFLNPLGPFVWFFGKTLVLVFTFMWIRSTLPRIRIDQLMGFAWRVLIPVSFVNLIFAGFWVALR